MLASVKKNNQRVVVVFDEFQDLLVARKDLDGLLRSRIQYHGDAAVYVYAGSEPSMMHELFEARERPLFGQADPLDLGPLPQPETLDDLAGRSLAGQIASVGGGLLAGLAVYVAVVLAARVPEAQTAARMIRRRLG